MVVLSGCGMEEQVWELRVRGDGEMTNETFVFDGRVAIGGNLENVSVSDVRVQFLTEDNTTIRTVRVGDFGGAARRENLTIRLNQTPQYIRVVAGEVELPENARYGFSGLRRTDAGDYREYTQETTSA
ncbi:hypothetical protein ACFQH6_17520 [Halobacteriaceae archaeon GCM10025711]